MVAQMSKADLDKAMRIAGRVVMRKRHLFTHLPDVTADDLRQEARLAILSAGPVDPKKGAASTFWYLVASRKVIDIWRLRSRRFRIEQAGATTPARPVPPNPLYNARVEDGLVDYTRAMHLHCRRMYGNTIHKGRFYRLAKAQAGVLVLLMNKLHLDADGVRGLLVAHPELREVIGLRRTPPRAVFLALERLIEKSGLTCDEDGDLAMRAAS